MREKIINAILDCKVDYVDSGLMESYAKQSTKELVDEFIGEMYTLRADYDNILAKSNEDTMKLLNTIEELKRKLQQFPFNPF